MPQMVLNRNYTLRTTLGHTLGFEKGKPLSVPSICVEAALQIGAEPVSESDQKDVDKELSKHDQKEKSPELQGAERRGKIKEILEIIAARNRRDDFMASNKPHLKVVQAELEFTVTAAERDEIWDEVVKERARSSGGDKE
jgi:hypothetical protein